MRYGLRLTIAIAAIVVFCGGCGPMKVPPRDNDLLFKQAWSLDDSGRPQEALEELKRIAQSEASNPEAAAKALYQAGLLAAYRFGKSEEEKRKGRLEGAKLWEELAEKYPKTEAAKQILEEQPDRADSPAAPQGRLVALYSQIGAAESRDDEAAAEALYLGGLFASEKFRGSSTEKKNEAELAAAQTWKQLAQDYAHTVAGKRLIQPSSVARRGKLVALETEIVRRNSADFKYKILSTLVKATGSIPSFSYAFALILLAVIVKVLTFPLTKKQYAGMRDMQKMQPLIKEMQKKYKGAELHEKTMALYKEHKVNPFGGCLPMLVQMPFLIFLFTAIREYEFAFAHGTFLWIGSPLADPGIRFMGHNLFGHDLSEPDIPLLALYAITMYITTRLTPATDPQQQQQQQTMALVMSGFFFFMFLSYRWSSAFVLYWLIQNILSIWQQYTYIYKPHLEKQAAAGSTRTGPDISGTDSNGSGKPPVEVKPIGKPGPPARVKPRRKKK